MIKRLRIGLLVVFLFMVSLETVAAAGENDCSVLTKTFNTDVKRMDTVCSVQVSRKDIKVNLEGVRIPPEMVALALSADFVNRGKESVVTGEFALLDQEINPVIDALRNGKLKISALHNHFIEMQPPILYLHFQGTGELEGLAQTVKNAMDAAQAR